ncbi:ISAs1 family transposase [Pantanalinema sp. GBBB05]|uniref:ISAs1 family transposase n=1 Tax=Pantanalinema sp. GBBB05 TaxID=2604139 RepID=UPI001D8A9579|nr:ISAs1 family transposase [Pantanalinema sp. GBBB05]
MNNSRSPGLCLVLMPCTCKKTVQLIEHQGNDYVIAVKGTQGRLFQQIVKQARTTLPRSQVTQHETGQGRTIQRAVSTFDLAAPFKQQWSGAQQAVHIHCVGKRSGKAYEENLYYLTSLNWDASSLMVRIRAHWGIENRLHWVKDVVLPEDGTSIQLSAPASLMAILRSLAVSLFQAHGYASTDRRDSDQVCPTLGCDPS